MKPPTSLSCLALSLCLGACDRATTPVPEPAPSAAAPASASAVTSASAAATPVPAPTRPPVRRTLDCGNYFGCTVDAGKKVACWGFNQFGQLGSGRLPYPRKGRSFVTVPTASAVAVGLSHACALTTEGEVHCWGDESNGAAGNGRAEDPDSPKARISPPAKVAGLGAKAVDVDVSIDSSCAALEDGRVLCWGAMGDASGEPKPIEGLRDVVELAINETGQSCARASSGAVSCWGGKLGPVPQLVDGLCATQITVSAASACAVDCGGGVRCWGSLPGYGNDAPTPKAQAALKDVVEIRGGLAHYIARDTSGRVITWGGNDSGQLGNGKPASWEQAYSEVPVTLSTPWKSSAVCAGGVIARPGDGGYLRPATFVDTGASCARSETGEVHCWGEPDLDYEPKRITLPK